MDYGHPLRFGVFLTPDASDPLAVVGRARLAEELGLDLVSFQDHPYQPAFLDAWTLLAWVAGATERIAVAGNVLNAAMRPPAVLARAAASLDLLSGGRVELGLGAGAFWDAMVAMGVERLTPGESVTALAEAIEVVRSIWAAGDPAELHVDGEHHEVHAAQRGPAPAHEIPVWVGGLRPRMLRLVGELADGWLPSSSRLGPGGLAAGHAAIDRAARAVGRDPREIRRLLNIEAPSGLSAALGSPGPRGAEHAASGRDLDLELDSWTDELVRLALEHGVSTFILASDDEHVVRELATRVAPAVRRAVAGSRDAGGVVVGVPVASRLRARRRPGIDYDAVPAGLDAVEPGEARFANVRTNYLRGGDPGVVLVPRDAGELGAALGFARDQGVPLGVRSGGHGISGRSTNDGGIVVDLSRFDSVEVLDPTASLVRVGAGARWSQVAARLAPHGLAVTSGDSGGVGVGGLATAGGIGWYARKHGLTIDRVRAVDVVLADGTAVRASPTEHPDLFWGMRGAGGNLAVATSFEIEAHPGGPLGFAQLVLDASDVSGFLERWGAVVEASSRDVTSFLLLGAPRRGQPPVAQVMVAVDAADAGTVIGHLEPFARIAPLLDQSVRIAPYGSVIASPLGPHRGEGEPVTRSSLVAHLSPEVARAAERIILGGASSFFQVRAVGGAVSDVGPDATAYAHRSARFSVIGMGSSRARLDPAWDELHQHAQGLYLSFETDPRPERLLDAFPPATLARLRDVKGRYDPGDLFRDNFPVGSTAGGR